MSEYFKQSTKPILARGALAASLLTGGCAVEALDNKPPVEISIDQSHIESRSSSTIPEQIANNIETESETESTQSVANQDARIGWHILAYGNDINSARTLSELNRLNADRAVFNPALFMNNGLIETSSAYTPEPDQISELSRTLLDDGIGLAIKPIIDSESLGDSSNSPDLWRGTFAPSPTNQDQWFESYFIAAENQFFPAYQEGVRHFVIGTELTLLEDEEYAEYWIDEINYLRETYPDIKISYNMNWDSFNSGQIPAFVEYIDELAVSGFFPFVPGDKEDYEEQWDQKLDELNNLSEELGMPVVLGEAGIAFSGSPANPSAENKTSGIRDAEMVIDYLGALCNSAVKSDYDINVTLWAASYTGHEKSDSQNGFYHGHSTNRAVTDQIVDCLHPFNR